MEGQPMTEITWLLDADHEFAPEALEAAARAYVELRDDDPDRLMYGRRIFSNGMRSLTCPMVPYWQIVAEQLIMVFRAYEGAKKPCPNCDGTGDVHRIDGEWMGRCHCGASPSPL